MNHPLRASLASVLSLLMTVTAVTPAFSADHNDPIAVNSIFSDTPVSAGDLYDYFGWPSDDGSRVIVALTFAAVPQAGKFDTDFLYRMRFYTSPRSDIRPPAISRGKGAVRENARAFAEYVSALAQRIPDEKSEIRVSASDNANGTQTAQLSFIGFPGAASFTARVSLGGEQTITTPDGYSIKAFVGGRDDAFFNDLPGFFRSINYAPQFYQVPQTAPWAMRELEIPKTLLELEGNTLFNFDPAKPQLGMTYAGRTVKEPFPQGAPTKLAPTRYARDAQGRYKMVYTGRDAQAGININSIILEIPHAFLSRNPSRERLVNTWGESWVRTAASKVDTVSDRKNGEWTPSEIRRWLGERAVQAWTRQAPPAATVQNLDLYKPVDIDGQAFADAALNERRDLNRAGVLNFASGARFATRLAHLGWGFAPSVTTLGLKPAFDHGKIEVPTHRTYSQAQLGSVLPLVAKTLFQELKMPPGLRWKRDPNANIPLRRSFEVFVPNVSSIDMDTTGTWPYGRRLEDQVATRFLALFLDMEAHHLETLHDPAMWAKAPISKNARLPHDPKYAGGEWQFEGPNPYRNDKPFSSTFPYLAAPHGTRY
jgi:hypothetical protein